MIPEPTYADLERFMTKAEELLSPEDQVELVRLISTGSPNDTFAFLHSRIPNIHELAKESIQG